jgi:SAM-dependent methyltransferase
MSSLVQSFYDDFASQQLQTGVNLRHKRIMGWLLKFGLHDRMRVLEIGCGVGTQTSLLSQALLRGRLVANDISPISVEHARARLAHEGNVEFIIGDIVQMNVGGEFDMIVLPDVLEHIPLADHGPLFHKLRELIKEDGQIVIHIPSAQYLDWVIEHHPERLQVIDQPLHLNVMLPHITAAGLYLHIAEHYGLWTDGPDAAVLVLRPYKNDLAFNLTPPPVGLFGRWRRRFARFRHGDNGVQ